MATALKAAMAFALGGKRNLFADLSGHVQSRKLNVNCQKNICGRKLTDAKACDDFGDDNKDCAGACLTGFELDGDACILPDQDNSAVVASTILQTGMSEWTGTETKALKRSTRKANARRWFQSAFTARKAKIAHSTKKNRAIRKELRLAAVVDDDFSDEAKAKLVAGKTYFIKPGPSNKDAGDTCASNSAAEDDTCVTTVLGLDEDEVDKNILACDDGCWQVGGIEVDGKLSPFIKQRRVDADSPYKMSCWEGTAWGAESNKVAGDEVTCTVGIRSLKVVVGSMTTNGDEVAVAEYHGDSKQPQAPVSGDDDRGKTFTSEGQNLDSITSAKMIQSGEDLVVSVTSSVPMDSTASAFLCTLSVGVAHDAANSDATLKDGNKFIAGAANSSSTQVSVGENFKFEVTVKPSSYDLVDNKLHTGRLGVTLTPKLTCTGTYKTSISQDHAGTTVTAQDGIHLRASTADANGHAARYDLKATGLITTDAEGGSAAGALSDGTADDAKRSYSYSADFTHSHLQVVFPETSIAGKGIEDHFDGLSPPANAKCAWAASDYHADLTNALQTTLKTNTWMSDDDATQPEGVYGNWTALAAGCTAGECTTLQKSATVDGSAAYLPFDKPLTSYYQTQPSVVCASQKGGVAGAAATTLTPNLAGDTAAAIVSGVLVGHQSLAKVDCTRNGVDASVCVAPADGKVIGQLFTLAETTADFTNLITDGYNFNLTVTCVSSAAGTTDACAVTDITDATGLVSSKTRADLATDMTALAAAVTDTTFSLPTKYGTTFDNFDASVGAHALVTDSSNAYRIDANFSVVISADEDILSWDGDDKQTAAGFNGPEVVTATHGTKSTTTQTRVSADAVSYMKADDALVFDNNGNLDPFKHADNYDPGETAVDSAVDSTNCQASTTTVMCKSNGFAAYDCLSRELSVTYAVTTPTSDLRFPAQTATATKTWSITKTGSPAQSAVGFVVTAPQARTGIAGQKLDAVADSDAVDLNVATGVMGTDPDITFTRETPVGTTTYNCEDTTGRDITYKANVAKPCGEPYGYNITSELPAFYVYGAGTNDAPDQVSQTSTDAVQTSEWHVQESTSTAQGYVIPVPIVIENDASVTSYDAAVHLPTSKVSLQNVSLSVKGTPTGAAGTEGVRLKNGNGDCKVNDAGKRECTIEYWNTNDYEVSYDANAQTPVQCGDTDEHPCPQITYEVVSTVSSGNVADAFGQAQDCGSAATVPSKIADRTVTLNVVGNPRAYDGVIDVHAKTGTTEQKPDPLATEDVHGAVVPGKDGAAITILDMNPNVATKCAGETCDFNIADSKDVAFRVKFLKTGTGNRKFKITPLDVDDDTWGKGANKFNDALPSPVVCSSADYDNDLCTQSGDAAVSDVIGTVGCDPTNAEPYLPYTDAGKTELKSTCVGSFYFSLGSDVNTDICENTAVNDDPYTVDGLPYLGFSIQVIYDGGSGEADSGVPHKYMFALRCPTKEYSLNMAAQSGGTRKIIPQSTNVGLVNKVQFGASHDDKITLNLFYSGRSSGDKTSLPLTLQANPDVKMVDATDPGGELGGELVGDSFLGALPVTFEFQRQCLFTEIVLQSQQKLVCNDGDASACIQKSFTFKLQCPRYTGTSTDDSLSLTYDITGQTFDNEGGSITVTNPATNGFDSVSTGLVGQVCSGTGGGAASTINANCSFDPAEGAQSLAKTGGIANWFNFLKSCDFVETSEGSGVYAGAVQRTYVRDHRIGNGQASYCGGRKIKFGVTMTGSHTAYVSVGNPQDMDFGVQALELYWGDCDAGAGAGTGKQLQATIQLQRKFAGETTFEIAAGDAVTDMVKSPGALAHTEPDSDTAQFTVTGQCIANPSPTAVAGDGECTSFESPRTLDFGIEHLLNGIDYRGDLSVSLQMSCPLPEIDGSGEGSQIALRHTSKCEGYASGDGFTDCPDADTDGDGTCDYVDANNNDAKDANEPCNVARVEADEQIQLELIIDDAAFAIHDVSAPTITIAGSDLWCAASDQVTDFAGAAKCPVSALTAEYVAANADGSDIALVQGGGASGTGKTADEENSKVTLRALALSGKSASITWDVERKTANRRMLRQTVTYALGADDSQGHEGAGFVVLPATRDGDSDSISVDELPSIFTEAEASAGTTHTHEHHADDHHEEGWGLLIFGIVGGGLLLTVVIAVVFTNGQKEVVYASTPSSGFANRFYRYSKVDNSSPFDRNRFRS
jgi:hypothetical protein